MLLPKYSHYPLTQISQTIKHNLFQGQLKKLFKSNITKN